MTPRSGSTVTRMPPNERIADRAGILGNDGILTRRIPRAEDTQNREGELRRGPGA
jgi:hypothetical protein